MPRIGLDLPTLIQEATEIADSQGLESVTLATLAQRLQIRSPSLYNHIKGLPDLRRLLAITGLTKMLEQFKQALADKSGDEAIRALSHAYLIFARAHPGLYEAVQRAAEPDDEHLQEAGHQVVQIVLSTLQEYGLEGNDTIHYVRVIRSMLHGFVSLEQQGGFGMPLDLDTTFYMLTTMFLEGLKSLQTQADNLQ